MDNPGHKRAGPLVFRNSGAKAGTQRIGGPSPQGGGNERGMRWLNRRWLGDL